MQTATTERRGRGRPPKGAPKTPRMGRINFTLTAEGAGLIQELATRLGVSQSEFLERAAKHYAATANAA